jgi:hypothetical protein
MNALTKEWSSSIGPLAGSGTTTSFNSRVALVGFTVGAVAASVVILKAGTDTICKIPLAANAASTVPLYDRMVEPGTTFTIYGDGAKAYCTLSYKDLG